jgi:hypothetical protein
MSIRPLVEGNEVLIQLNAQVGSSGRSTRHNPHVTHNSLP